MIDEHEVRVELARRGLRQLELAHRLGVPVTTLGSWLRGAHPGPPELAERIEQALGLAAGALGGGRPSGPRGQGERAPLATPQPPAAGRHDGHPASRARRRVPATPRRGAKRSTSAAEAIDKGGAA